MTRIIECSLVTAANQHNPSIINPTFLRLNHIVQHEWNWHEVDDQCFTTSIHSRVAWDSSVRIEAEPRAVRIIEDGFPVDVFASKVPYMAKLLCETLPHIKYTAFGINFKATLDSVAPEEYIANEFLAPSKHRGDFKPVELKLSREHSERCTLNLALAAAEGQRSGQDSIESFVLISANYHHELDDAGIALLTNDTQTLWRTLFLEFQTFLKTELSIVLENGDE